jgi:ribosomal protein L31
VTFTRFLVQVYPAGDANGDGLKDFAVITSTMKAYIVFGSSSQASTGVRYRQISSDIISDWHPFWLERPCTMLPNKRIIRICKCMSAVQGNMIKL